MRRSFVCLHEPSHPMLGFRNCIDLIQQRPIDANKQKGKPNSTPKTFFNASVRKKSVICFLAELVAVILKLRAAHQKGWKLSLWHVPEAMALRRHQTAAKK